MRPIQKLFSSNVRVFKINFGDISHPLGLPAIADEKMKEVNASGVTRPYMSKAEKPNVLKEMYKNSQPFIMQEVEKLKDKDLLEQLTFLGFHETYHLGQIGLIRKLLGKEGAIK